MGKPEYTTSELAALAKASGLPVAARYIDRLCGQGRIPARRVGSGARGVWLISADDARRWLEDWVARFGATASALAGEPEKPRTTGASDMPFEKPDAEYVAQMLRVSRPLKEPVMRSAIQALQLPQGSRGLDAGCGIGLEAVLLAEAVGPTGHVTGLDLSPELLVHAKDIVQKAGLSKRVSFRQGDASELPFQDGTFDWAWSVDCVGPAPPMVPALNELARVVKPGGTVAVLSWSSERLLPGHPLLEARLAATSAGLAPSHKGTKPASHFLRGLGWFRDAGLAEPRARTFVGDAHAPLADDVRAALVALFQMRWPGVEAELTPEDYAEYQRLCQPQSPDFVVDHPDYYAFFTYSMFLGQVPEQR